MGKKMITTWEPDTCGCIVEYSWDRDTLENPEQRVHTFHGHSRRCSDHEHLWDDDVYQTVLEENQRKNITLGYIAQNTTLGHDIEVKDSKGRAQTQRRIKPDVKHNFFFTHQDDPQNTSHKHPRVLHLTFNERLNPEHHTLVELFKPGLIKIHQ